MERRQRRSFMEALVKLLNMLVTLQVGRNRVRDPQVVVFSKYTQVWLNEQHQHRFLVFNPAV